MIANQRSHSRTLKTGYPDDKRPWVPTKHFECKYQICPPCHRIKHRAKSWVSLDGVLNGDILPSVATGFSFLDLGSRPVLKASVAEVAGYRPVPPASKLPANNVPCVDGEVQLGNLDQPGKHPLRRSEPPWTGPVTADKATPAAPCDGPTSEPRDVLSVIIGILVVLYLAFRPKGAGVH